jgi:glycopeptide antibiotics resistance protein
MILGLSTRRFPIYFPNWINLYLGDALWALMIFFLFGLLFRTRETRWVTVGALLFSFSIEISQLYHSQWIDSLRKTRIGGLVLGYGFLWSDLLSYTVGIGVGVLIERLMFLYIKRR